MSEKPRLCDFEPVSHRSWAELARRELGGADPESLRHPSLEEVEIDPIYTREQVDGLPGLDSMPGAYPFVRGRTALGPGADGWQIVQEYAQQNPADAAKAAGADLRAGARALWFVPDASLRAGISGLEGSGIALGRQPGVARLLRDLDLAATSVFFEAGVAATAFAGMLASIVGDATPGLAGGVLADPLAELARHGRIGVSLERAFDDMAELLGWCEVKAPGLAAVTVSTIPAHDAGASAVQELAVAFATGVHYLREMERRGLGPEAVAPRMVFRFCVGRDLFVSIAKLRAARLGWARVCEICGVGGAEAAMRLHVRGSWPTRTRRDPWVNLLRGTIESFAAVVGGADAIATTRMDEAAGTGDELSRRMAVDTQLLLREESHLGAVVDPAGGSYYVEAQTHALVRAAWSAFANIERTGGIPAMLESGRLVDLVGKTAALRAGAVATGGLPITGVSAYALLDEPPSPAAAAPALPAAARGAGTPADPAAVSARLSALATAPRGFRIAAMAEAAGAGAGVVEMLCAIPDSAEPPSVRPLSRVRLSEPFERLRDASDAYFIQRGRRPLVFVARVGAGRHDQARVDFVRDTLASGGIEVDGDAGVADIGAAVEAFRAGETRVVVICSSDDRYPQLVPALVPGLRAAGARRILLAGRPASQADALQAAGIDAFVRRGDDVPALLEQLLRALEVLS